MASYNFYALLFGRLIRLIDFLYFTLDGAFIYPIFKYILTISTFLKQDVQPYNRIETPYPELYCLRISGSSY